MSVATTAYWFFRRFLYDRDKGLCGLCREPVVFGSKMDIDHIVQLAEGGSDDPSNLRVTHERCNRKRPRIRGISTPIELDVATLVALKARADTQNFELTPFILHTLRRMVEDRKRRPDQPPTSG